MSERKSLPYSLFGDFRGLPGRVNRIMNALIPAAMARRLMASMLTKTLATY